MSIISTTKSVAELAVAAGDFAQSIADLAEADIGQHLSTSLAGLANMERKYQELQNTQSEQDMVTFLSTGKSIIIVMLTIALMASRTADEYTRLIGSVRVNLLDST